MDLTNTDISKTYKPYIQNKLELNQSIYYIQSGGKKMSELKTTLIEWNTAAGEKWMQVVIEGGTAAERKKQKAKTINDLKEFDERKWWHFWTWNWINPICRMLKKA